MKSQPERDYAESGLTIQYAMLDHFKRFPDKRVRPPYILWNGLRVTTADALPVQKEGLVRGEFLSAKNDLEQGFDIDLKGWLQLADGKKIKRLRTWNDSRYQAVVEYPFHTSDGFIWTWNVYKMNYPGLQVVEEKWTGNSGFWVEKVSETERLYHCSHGKANPPDFESLVYKVSVFPTIAQASTLKQK